MKHSACESPPGGLLPRRCYRGHDYETYDGAVLLGDRLSYVDGRAMTCVALHDPVRRRGLWFRVEKNEVCEPVAVRLFAGREGDDSGVSLGVGCLVDETRLRRLLDVLSCARWAYSLAYPTSDDGDNSRAESQLTPSEGGWCAEGDWCAGDQARNCFREVKA